MTDLKDVFHYFEMEIRHDYKKNTLMLLQIAYLKVVLKWFNITKYNLSTAFM